MGLREKGNRVNRLRGNQCCTHRQCTLCESLVYRHFFRLRAFNGLLRGRSSAALVISARHSPPPPFPLSLLRSRSLHLFTFHQTYFYLLINVLVDSTAMATAMANELIWNYLKCWGLVERKDDRVKPKW